MEHSASDPGPSFDYKLPCHGIGETGFPNKVLLGGYSKDTGKYSSRINQIIKQAEKVPGPGKYVAHEDWAKSGGFKFCNVERTYKSYHKNPASTTYERKDFATEVANAAKPNLSHIGRVLHGKVPKGKKRSFTDQVEHHGKVGCPPGAGTYTPLQKCGDRMEPKLKGVTEWSKEVSKTSGRVARPPEIGPNHYTPNHKHVEGNSTSHSVPKDKANNFIDKAVTEKMLSVRDKKPLPGPGAYDTHTMDDSKISRGTYQLQLRGLSRSSMSGYF